MDVETADQLWRHFTDVDGAAKRGHGIGFEPQAAFEHALEQKFPTSSGRDGRSHITGENTRHKSRRLEASNGGAAVSKPSSTAATLHTRFTKGANDLDTEAVTRDPNAIPGYADMTPVQKVRARMRCAQLREASQAQAVTDTARGWTRFAFNKHAALDEHQQDASEAGAATGGSYAINKRDVAELDAALAQSGARAAQLHADHDAAIFGARAPAEAPKAPSRDAGADAGADASSKGRRSGGVDGGRSSERRHSGTAARQHDRSPCDGRRSRHRSPAEPRERRHRSDHSDSQRTQRERSRSHDTVIDRGGSRRSERSRSHERHGGSGSRRRDRSRSRERPRDTGARRSDRSRSRERERGGSSRRRERSRSHEEHRANRGGARRGADSHDCRRRSRSRSRSRTPTRDRARRERDGSRRHRHERSSRSRLRDEERACSARDSIGQGLPAKDSSKRLRREGREDAGMSKRDRRATHEEPGTDAAPRPVPVQVEQTAPAAELRASAAGSGTAGVRASSGAHGGRSVHLKASSVEKGEHDNLSAMAKQMGLTLAELRDIVPEGAVVDQEVMGGTSAHSLQNEFDASAVAQLGESKKGSWRDRIRKRAL